MLHISVDQLRMIEWARTYNWAVQFPDAPDPFKEWFPATEVSVNIFNVVQQDFTAGMTTFSIPKSTEQMTISCTFTDGGKGRNSLEAGGGIANVNVLTLHEWLEKWSKDIVNASGAVKTLAEACKEMKVIYYNSTEGWIKRTSYAVFPQGQVNYEGNSDSGVHSLQVEFVVAASMSGDSRISSGNSIANAGVPSISAPSISLP